MGTADVVACNVDARAVMPTVLENRQKWSDHAWALEGHEWSPGGSAAGTELLWWRSIRPRIQASLPAPAVLEIAPGFGRWTSYLLRECERLVAVDVTARCVEVCRERFASSPHAQFWVNDGESLPMVASESIDFVFSFDSLVHVEGSQIRGYLRELSRKLRPGGRGFFHHSNLGAYAGPGGALPGFITRRHWRTASVSARFFREACREAGLVCTSQEVINWIGRGPKADRFRLAGERIPLTDCLSTFIRPVGDGPPAATRVYVNRRFVDEWRELLVLASLYGSGPPASADLRDPAAATPAPRRSLLRALRRAGIRGSVGAARERLQSMSEPLRARLGEEATGRWYAAREPVSRRLASARCSECGAAAARRGSAIVCAACHVTFVSGPSGG